MVNSTEDGIQLPVILTNLKGPESCFNKTLLVVGKTGTGKSSLCNVIAGKESTADLFPVSGEAVSCTQSTKFGTMNFNNDTEKIMNLIDTIGFDDSDKDCDIQIIAELIDKLMNNCDYVNLFAIAVNAQSPRLEGSLVAMIKIFVEMFGPQFWSQCVIVFTRQCMSKNAVNRRKKFGGKDNDELARSYLKEVESKFHNGGGLKYIFLDSCFEWEQDDEKEAFNKAMNELYENLEKSPKLLTCQVNKKVTTENGKLKAELEARERDKVEFAKRFEAMQQDMEKNQKLRDEDQAKFLEKEAELRAQLQALEKDAGRRGGIFLSEVVDALNPITSTFRTGVNSLKVFKELFTKW